MKTKSWAVCFAVAVATFAFGSAHATDRTFSATLAGRSESPANASTSTGFAEFTFDDTKGLGNSTAVGTRPPRGAPPAWRTPRRLPTASPPLVASSPVPAARSRCVPACIADVGPCCLLLQA